MTEPTATWPASKEMLTTSAEEPSNSLPLAALPCSPNKGATYGQVLKSSALVGGAQTLNIGIGILRTKVFAVLLGPAGFGLFGLYTSISNLAQTLAGMGVNNSGVRQIAAAVSTGDEKCIAQTVFVLRRVSFLLGLNGAALMVLFSRQISTLSFRTADRSTSISWLSLSVFLMLVSASQTALIQGLRRIQELAKIQILGALFGTLLSIPLVFVFRERGVVPSLICVAAMTMLMSWWYSRKVPPAQLSDFPTSAVRIGNEAMALLKLGLAFTVSGAITLGVGYAIRIAVLEKIGFAATGLYQSAWTLGGLYVGFILQAMGADFYPRLSGSAEDNGECNRLVNEQTHVGILLAGPGVLASISLAPLVMSVFYSRSFADAVPVLRWICLGAMLQVVSWPMGFIIIAKARRLLFILCEMAWGIVSIGLAWICIVHFGLVGTGIAFFGSYAFHAGMLYVVVGRLSGFRWSKHNRGAGVVSLSMTAAVFCGFYLLPPSLGLTFGLLATVLHLVYSVRSLTCLFRPEEIPGPIMKILASCRWILRHAG